MRWGKPEWTDDPAWRRRVGLAMVAVGASIMLVVPLARWYEQAESPRPSERSDAGPDLVTGARGAFPAPLGTTAPSAPDHVVRPTTTDDALVHGLGVRATEAGVRAVNLRTGKQYWRYERRSKDVWDPWVEVSERTVVVWFADGRITAVDLRTGKPLWHERNRLAAGERTMLGRIVGGQVITEVPGGVSALAERDGRTLWTVRPRGSHGDGTCDETPVRAVHAFPDHLSTVMVRCDTLTTRKQRIDPHEVSPETEVDADKSRGILLGVDNRTGDVLWQRRSGAEEEVGKGDENTLVALDPYASVPRVDLLDVDRAGASRRAGITGRERRLSAVGDGVVVSTIDPEVYAFDSNNLLSVYDTQDGHLLWKLPAPSRQVYGHPVVADGRVYVVRQADLVHRDVRSLSDADLLVFDARTGRPLHTVRLPALAKPKKAGSGTVLDLDVADGAVRVRWAGGEKDLFLVTDRPLRPVPRIPG
ncbi:PQQ-binding-like beta-propeller repeat protein [Streptomyces scabiei]|uniref:outer membrane protein assembly factor BamB family protein n=1 Tax=Streptomyces scabiei TaxID=1930 RepID=UPI0038F6E015